MILEGEMLNLINRLLNRKAKLRQLIKNQRNFAGFPMQQNGDAIRQFTKLFTTEKFESIIEIGTGKGGFAVFLAYTARLIGALFVTYDNRFSDASSLIRRLGGMHVIADIFNYYKEVAKVFQGKTLLLCDGGDKIKEFHTFAPYLKKGDMIMAHDYCHNEDRKYYGESVPFEIDWHDIKECCERQGIVPVD